MHAVVHSLSMGTFSHTKLLELLAAKRIAQEMMRFLGCICDRLCVGGRVRAHISKENEASNTGNQPDNTDT